VDKDLSSDTSNLFANLGRELASTANAEMAAHIIVDVADKLIGWDACYLILYDPENGTAPRPLLTIDTIDGKRKVLKSAVPEYPSNNMLSAIQQDGLSIFRPEDTEPDPSISFGDKSRLPLSLMFVPVQSQARTIAVLSVQSYSKNAYTSEHLNLLKNLADHCAGALERIWAQEALADMAERLKVLHQAVHNINLSLDMEQLCDAIHTAVEKVMPCDDFIIDGYDSETNEIVPIYAIEYPRKRVLVERYLADHGMAGYVVHQRKSVMLNSTEDVKNSGIDFEFYGTAAEDKTQSLIAVPMLLQGRIMGMISAQSYKPNAYTTNDHTLLELLGAHAAVAIENARLFNKAQHLANIDVLTEVLSRRKFYELARTEFNKAVRYKKNLSCIMLDIDNFKTFNDKYGHKVGDHVLRTVADRCKESIRNVDILGRLGGEEFAVLLPETGLSQAEITADRLRRTVEEINFSEIGGLFDMKKQGLRNEEKLKIAISVGVAELDETCKTIDMIIDRADRAMYKGKHLGGNQVNLWDKAIEST